LSECPNGALSIVQFILTYKIRYDVLLNMYIGSLTAVGLFFMNRTEQKCYYT